MWLSILHMEKVGMGDEGMRALARAVAEKFVRLEKLHCIGTMCDNWVDSDEEEEEEPVRPIITVLDEGVRALAEAMAGGRREEGNTQGRMPLPKLLTLIFNVLGLEATEREMTPCCMPCCGLVPG